jgi:cation diffusion facilitator family transporter
MLLQVMESHSASGLGFATPFRDKAAMTSDARDDAPPAARGVTRLSVGVAVALIGVKAFALGASGSVSMLASLADSALDLVASLGVILAVRRAAAPPDDPHRRRPGKEEALAALVQAGLVFASCVFIGWEAIQRMIDPRPVTAGAWAVAAVAFSIGLTVGLAWLRARGIRRTGSPAIQADRAPYTADLAANAVVLIGVASGAFLDAPGLDAAAGLIVTVWLFWGALGLLRTAADQLLDRAAPDADRVAITSAVLADPRITGVHRLRACLAGPALRVRMHVDLDPSLTLAEAQAILAEAEERILAAYPQADILIHPDPRGRTPPAAGPWGGEVKGS